MKMNRRDFLMIGFVLAASTLMSADARSNHAVRVTAEYSMTVNGRPVNVRKALNNTSKEVTDEYAFATFDCDGAARVRIVSDLDMSNTVIRPLSKRVGFTLIDKHTIEFTAKTPFHYSVEPSGRQAVLEIFGNRPERDVPAQATAGVIYFGPGDHYPGVIRPNDGQTVYLAEGAVVHGAIMIEGKRGVTIRGRGVLYGGDWEKFKGPAHYLFHARRCRDLRVEGITLQASWCWTCVLSGCDGVTMENVKWCGGSILNDDSIDIVNSSGVTVRDCFIRGQDDLIAIKGSLGMDNKNCENILVERCVFFNDCANICRYGYECAAKEFRNIVMRDCDIIHATPYPRDHKEYWANCCFFLQASGGLLIRDILFENIRIEDDRKGTILLKAAAAKYSTGIMNGEWVHDKAAKDDTDAGNIDGVVLRDIRVIGERAGESDQNITYLVGADTAHTVRNVKFENVSGTGRVIVDNFADQPMISPAPEKKGQ